MSKAIPPLVSVLIPAYNAEKYLAEALSSILSQTYSNLEIIVVNDGSIDNTGGILENFRDKRLKIIHQENQGQCAASNRAFRESTGELIKFFDADDILNPENIELQVKRLNGSYDYVASSEWGRFYDDDLSTYRLNPEPVWKDMTPVDWIVESLQDGPNMMQCAIWLIPRKILEKSGLWDERLSLNNDLDFFFRVLLASKGILFTPGARLFYRSGNKNSLSQTFSRKALEAAILSNRLGVEHLLNAEDSPRTRQTSANALQIWAYSCYPDYPDLTSSLENQIALLGGSTIPFPGGRPRKLLAKVLGWKKAARIHHWYEDIRYPEK